MITLKQVLYAPVTKSVEATWVDADGLQVKCHSYADVQMQMFRDDVAQFGGDISDYEPLIVEVEEAIVTPPPPTPEEVIAYLTGVVQQHLDNTAKTRGYDSILSACTYAADVNTKFKAEGQACANWRGAVWSTCYAIAAEVQAGNRTAPTAASLITELPSMVWPE